MESEVLERQTTKGLAELRIQLAQMTAASQILEEHAQDERARGYLAIMNQSICRMLRVIGRMELSRRLTGTEVKASFAPTDLGQFVRELGERMGRLLQGAGVTLNVQSPERLPAVADTVLLEQMLLELIANAARAGKMVALALAKNGLNASFTISDNGPGISSEELSRLFSPDRAGTPDWRQSGSGIAIAQAIAALHGGVLMADSAAGQGLRVAVNIPLRAEEYTGPMNSPKPRWDAGGFDAALVGLSHLLPSELFHTAVAPHSF